MSGVFFGDALSFEDVPQVAITSTAENLNSIAIGIDLPSNRAGYFIIKGRPAAVGLKFVLRTIQGLITLATNVNARFKMIVIFTGKGPFRTFL
jgi:hypothetical protein